MRAFDTERNPQELEPARVNTKRLFIVGSACWLVALAAVGILSLSGRTVDGRLVPLCLVGIGLGAAGYVWSQWMDRRDAARESSEA